MVLQGGVGHSGIAKTSKAKGNKPDAGSLPFSSTNAGAFVGDVHGSVAQAMLSMGLLVQRRTKGATATTGGMVYEINQTLLVDAGGQRLELLWRWWAQQGQSNEGQVSRPPSPVRVLCRPGGAPVSPLPERPAYGEQVGVSRPAVGGLLLGQPRLHLPAHSPPRQNALPPCKAAAGKLTHTGRHRGRWRER